MLDSDERSLGLPTTLASPRRRWSEAEKRRIVAESYQGGFRSLWWRGAMT